MSQNTPDGIDRAAARLVVDLTFDAIDEAALAGARRLIQDQLALQIGCSTLPWCQAVLEMTRASHAPGRAGVVAAADRFSAADAAFVNATYGHSFEFDDAHSASLSHPGSAVVSAALAIGEELGADSISVVEGIVAGYEVYTRIGTLAAPSLLHKGFHPHAILAPFGAAATAAKMRGYDLETTGNALAIAMSHSSGTTEYTSSGGSVKRVHSGIGTRNGIRAADLAAAGITGPTRYLSGSKGFFASFVQHDVDDDPAVFSLNRPFEIAGPLFKPYCCCGYNHAFIDAARRFTDRADEVAGVRLGISTGGDTVIGNRNAHAWAPETIEQLQYALPIQTSLSLLGIGNGYSVHKSFLDGELDLAPSSRVAMMARKVVIEVDESLERAYPGKLVGDLTVTFADGSAERVFVEDSIGSAPNPMPEAELDAKSLDLIGPVLGEARADELITAVKTVPADVGAADLIALAR